MPVVCTGAGWPCLIGITVDFCDGVKRKDWKGETIMNTQEESSQGVEDYRFQGLWQGACLTMRVAGGTEERSGEAPWG